jgi:hypothetical protein
MYVYKYIGVGKFAADEKGKNSMRFMQKYYHKGMNICMCIYIYLCIHIYPSTLIFVGMPLRYLLSKLIVFNSQFS